ncbi:hypothetical protein G3576_20805 [Roseomonas stagni]|uniref:Uncharacterized protein n=1 Tax=Falsiroseomonas algicola TaxID=2716930 RepID=A0A6M1LQ10_9PROT|nr:hypothetical protein [Falsiroseomonas algicola]
MIRAPKPAAPAADSTAATVQAQADAAAAAQASADAAAETARRKALDRARRGLAGTIATSARGVLDPVPGFAQRKNLLGE